MSQAQLAKKLGVAALSISRWERGERTPHMPAAVLALVDTLEALPEEDRRIGKVGRPPKGRG